MTNSSSQPDITDWFQKLFPFRLDLVGDYAGSERFLIDGDSLFCHIVSDPRIDLTTGYQLLHVVYAVELFLENLRSRKCQFEVVFFSQHERLAGDMLFIREIMKHHLKAPEFVGIADPKFDEFLRVRTPYFVMCHDGSGIKDQDLNSFAKMILRRFLIKRYNVAVINRVEFIDSKVRDHFSLIVSRKLIILVERIFTFVIESHFHGAQLSPLPATPASKKRPWFFPPIPDSIDSKRDRLTIATMIFILHEAPDDVSTRNLVSLWLLHTALLRYLSLNQRISKFWAIKDVKECTEVTNLHSFRSRFLSEALRILKDCDGKIGGHIQDLHDFMDGWVMVRLLMQKHEIPEEVESHFNVLKGAVQAFVDADLVFPKTGVVSDAAPPRLLPVPDGKTALLPFSNEIFDPYLSIIKLSVDENADSEDDSDQPYEERYHWHNAKKLLIANQRQHQPAPIVLQRGGKGQQAANIWEKRRLGRARKWEQKYTSQMTRYAESLNGGILAPERVIVGPKDAAASKKGEKVNEKREKQPEPKMKEPNKGKGKKGKKAPVLSKSDQIRQKNAELKSGKEMDALIKTWTVVCGEIDKLQDQELKVTRLDNFLKRIEAKKAGAVSTTEASFIDVERRVYKILILHQLWFDHCKTKQKDRGYNVAALIFDEARKVLQSSGLTLQIYNILKNVFTGFGIPMPPTTTAVGSLPKRNPICKTLFNVEGRGDLNLEMSSIEFQLKHFGPYMDRDMDSAPDDRVPFEPDGWQRKVLDEIDNDNSVFVVAPTSAGKTFISFHAMKKVLKEDDQGILVYIAPTKALVNQIAAEVMSRFSKDYPHRGAGKTVWAIHTRDYRINNPDQCQILITVPQILSIMLLSPSNAKKWSPRIKRIIFDEVHSIGNADEGVVWEQLLLLAPCPIIALSATVGNPEELKDWLQATQANLGIKLSMIQHPHRYSDLRKFIYRPSKSTTYRKFQALPRVSRFGVIDGTPDIVNVHPISTLHTPSHGLPDDLALEPKDCFSLWQAMKKLGTGKWNVPDDVDPPRVFGTKGAVIKKRDVVEWEASLKSILRKWMASEDSPFLEVVEMLGKTQSLHSPTALDEINTNGVVLEDPDLPGIPPLEKPQKDTYIDLDIRKTSYIKDTTLPLLEQLHSSNALPAIFFSYDRGLCEYLLKHVSSQLQEAERKWRETNTGWKALMKQYESYQARKLKPGKEKKLAKNTKLGEGMDKRELQIDEMEIESNPMELFDPEAPSPEFSFADFTKHSKEELGEDLASSAFWRTDRVFIDALKRGIGVHHAGMNRQYRQVVEILFRKGYLRVVFATGTLSLGINMPTKTVVFAGDSVYLTALNYRQASGRAGRRGFDLLGNVIFHAIPSEKVHRLISSRLPSIIGHFPVSTSLILRLFILLHNSGQSPHATTSIQSLLTQPRLVIGSQSFRNQVLHHLRFSIEYLRRQKLLGPTGTPINFAGITSHLYYTEPSAFSFHSLLISGYIGDVCRGIRTNTARTLQNLMLILCHLFERRPCAKDDGIKTLPLLPEEAAQIIKAQNRDTLDMLTTYVTTFAKEYSHSEDNTLPFSGIVCGGPGASGFNSTRSNFVALSGHTDCFDSIEDLVTSVRSDIKLEGASVPYLNIADNEHLNGHVFEFFRHGDLTKMTSEHRIKPGERWFILRNFALDLATIVTGLICYYRDGPGAWFDVSRLGEGLEPAELDDEGEEESYSEESDLDKENVSWQGKRDRQEIATILQAFTMLQEEYIAKFKAIGA
ncbi:P-loop containing nucleoside triphosphate hydrolase protein [Ascodesmis nigricans]|uniref:P-loop containing nucleoside triphosphate hydrolase protein n=1 Tax=Ascodesmis nigricans TaxID=341454 RepID=A0A4S2N4S4_9PEZI|nr:P-loop containing nucleoside triphosphate hydrolase protein [Ascodesmis nigricans]